MNTPNGVIAAFGKRLQALLALNETERAIFLQEMSTSEKAELRWHWRLWARSSQLPPDWSWNRWLICAGRGFGKTRAGAEWVREIAKQNSNARIALVGASLGEVRSIMVEGESGIIACSPPHRRPEFEPSLKKISWPNGAQAILYSAAEPDSLRGGQHSHAWCDEIAKWDTAGRKNEQSWDNLAMGLRLGDQPQVVATTTPKPIRLIKKLLATDQYKKTAITRGSTFENSANLPVRFIEDMQERFANTTFGRQELSGELLTDIEGALWSRKLLDRCRWNSGTPNVRRIVIGVDPPASVHGDACGIIVVGLTEEGGACVLADCSIGNASPERWARTVADAANTWSADKIVAEANQGGAMVESVLRAANISMPVKLVHASHGKVARAEPIATLYEAGRVRHIGHFANLEDELCGLMVGGQYEGPGRSPDRADALVWALHELMMQTPRLPRLHTDL